MPILTATWSDEQVRLVLGWGGLYVIHVGFAMWYLAQTGQLGGQTALQLGLILSGAGVGTGLGWISGGPEGAATGLLAGLALAGFAMYRRPHDM